MTTTPDPRDLHDLGEILHDTAAGDPGDEASLVIARSSMGTVMLAGYDGDGTGKLTHFFATNLGERATMLALGRALVGALEPETPLAAWERDLLDAPWLGPAPRDADELRDHPETDDEYFRRLVGEAVGAASVAWDETPRGVFLSRRAASIVDAIVEAATAARHLEASTPATRTQALELAVQSVEVGADLVAEARRIEAYLLGGAS